ncbi:MAG TPA: hemerythrin domain-containing protein [Polyangiales bacterium]|nr:hemerythrin domain-containing protein [Polyangiales bacterium]
MGTHIEQVTAKVRGKAKVAKGAIEGLSGIFITLMEEHGQVTALLNRLKGSTDVALRRELWPQLRAELLAHEMGELLVLYPVYRAHPEIRHIAEAHEREASKLQPLVEEINALGVEHAQWPDRFAALVQLVHDHVRDEEVDSFREGNRVFGSQNQALDEQYKRIKARGHAELI